MLHSDIDTRQIVDLLMGVYFMAQRLTAKETVSPAFSFWSG